MKNLMQEQYLKVNNNLNTEKEMKIFAESLEFERAAELRDQISILKEKIIQE